MDGYKNKHLKHDRKSKSPKYDTVEKKLVGSNVGLNLAQTSENFCSASKSLKVNEKQCSMTSCRSMCTEEDPHLRNLEEEVKERKQWAQDMVILAESLVKKQKKLNMLRMEIDKERREKVKKDAEYACYIELMEMEQVVWVAWTEACLCIEKCKRLEIENAQIMAKIEDSRFNLTSSKTTLKNAKKRERKKRRNAEQIEEQNRSLQAQEQKVLQLQLELLQVQKDAREAEMKWSHALHEKNHMLTVLAEVNKKALIRKANSRAKLSQLYQKLVIDCQRAEFELRRVEDEHRRLEAELSCLRLSLQVGDMLLYDSPEAVAFTARAFQEST